MTARISIMAELIEYGQPCPDLDKITTYWSRCPATEAHFSADLWAGLARQRSHKKNASKKEGGGADGEGCPRVADVDRPQSGDGFHCAWVGRARSICSPSHSIISQHGYRFRSLRESVFGSFVCNAPCNATHSYIASHRSLASTTLLVKGSGGRVVYGPT